MSAFLAGLGARLDRLLSGLLVLLMLTLVLSVTWQVISRYLLQAPSSWTEELARFLLIWIGLMGAAYAYRTRAHMGIDSLAGKLGTGGQRALRLIVALAVLLFASAVMLAGGLQLVFLTLELNQLSAALGVPMGLVYLAIPGSGLLIALYALTEIADVLAEPSNTPRGAT
jgi:TRAP-type C4-dicarboxylate transport system permease small subunit